MFVCFVFVFFLCVYMIKTKYKADNTFDGNADNSIDVYSYGILIWALCTSEEPYCELKMVNAHQLMAMVVGGYRPVTHLEKQLKREMLVYTFTLFFFPISMFFSFFYTVCCFE